MVGFPRLHHLFDYFKLEDSYVLKSRLLLSKSYLFLRVRPLDFSRNLPCPRASSKTNLSGPWISRVMLLVSSFARASVCLVTLSPLSTEYVFFRKTHRLGLAFQQGLLQHQHPQPPCHVMECERVLLCLGVSLVAYQLRLRILPTLLSVVICLNIA